MVEDNDPEALEQVFEVLIGTEDGHILHGAIESKATRAGKCDIIKEFSTVMETQFESISDIKIARINSFVLVLAVSETILYQFAGKDLDQMFATYSSNRRLVQEHSIVMSAKMFKP